MLLVKILKHLLNYIKTQIHLFNPRVVNIRHVSTYGDINLLIHSNGRIVDYRVKTFSTKEPETLNWIENFGNEGPFYDIGANIGLYSLYYAKIFGNKVYAFEPNYQNLVNLTKNINLNNLTEKIIVISNPIYSSNQISNFNLQSTEIGAAHSTFSEEFNQEGKPLKTIFKYKTLGLSLDYLFINKLILPPAIMKIDVDGIEHLILKGARELLSCKNLKSILVEVHPEFKTLSDSVYSSLDENNFICDRVSSSSENLIWHRS